jgi:hypothetical protein
MNERAPCALWQAVTIYAAAFWNLFCGALFPICATFLIGAIVVFTGIGSREVNSLPNGELIKFNWGQNNIETKFAQMRIAENVSIPDYASCPDWGTEYHLLKCNLRGEKIGSWSDKGRYKTSAGFQLLEIGIVCSPQTYAAVDFCSLCLGIADVLYHRGYKPSSGPAIIGHWDSNGAIIGNDPDLIRNNDGAVGHNFSIAGDVPLQSRENCSNAAAYSSYESKGRNQIIEPVFVLLCGFAAFSVGFWRMCFTARRGGFHTWAIAAALFLAGWLTCVASGIWLGVILMGHASPFSFAQLSVHSERVSAAPGIDASATCYGSAENVGVLPISVDHNAQMAFWAEPSLAQKGGVN